MRLLVGDDVGQAKVIETSNGIDTTLPTSARATTISFFPPSRTRPIQHALPAAVFSKGGLLRIFDPVSSPSSPDIVFSHTLDVAATTDTIALGACGNTLYAATATGHVLFLDLTTGSYQTATLSGPISAFAASSHLTAIATGGENKEIEIFTPANGAWNSIWKSRNVKPNHLKLEIPVHPSQIHFLPSVDGTYRLIVSSHHGHIRVYDTAVSRRPVFSAEPSKTGIQVLRIHPSSEIPSAEEPLVATKGIEADKAHLTKDLRAVYANSSGLFCVYSLQERREVGIFKGLEGATNGVDVDGQNGLVAGVGFGRYAAVYDADTRSLKSRVYTKTQGCCIVVLDGVDPVIEEPERDKEEDVWDDMEEVKTTEADDETDRLVKVRIKRKKDGMRQEGGKKPRMSE
ncbi:WD40-repeat-containing domain protein [Trichophaea hybrida]|nr:WD40-repeat-containing domain protein [Trichophaea hybrida]